MAWQIGKAELGITVCDDSGVPVLGEGYQSDSISDDFDSFSVDRLLPNSFSPLPISGLKCPRGNLRKNKKGKINSNEYGQTFDHAHLPPVHDWSGHVGGCMLSVNLRSMSANISRLRELLVDLQALDSLPQIIAVQEIWKIPEGFDFIIPGFQKLIATSRNTKKQKEQG